MSSAMRSLASILFAALIVPALLLPADFRLCLCEYFGRAQPVACCSRPCCAPEPTAAPSLKAAGCGGCRFASLGHETAAPTREKQGLRHDSDVVAPLALLDETPAPRLLAAPRIDTFLRDELRRPPPLRARASPLLL
jgi:hypothetical protein